MVVVGSVSGTVTLTVPQVTLTGTLAAALDSAATSGPKVSATGTGVVLEVARQRLSAARISFSRRATARCPLGLTDGELVFADGSGTPLVRATDIDGAFSTTSAGVYGVLTGTVVVDVPGVAFGPPPRRAVNTTAGRRR